MNTHRADFLIVYLCSYWLLIRYMKIIWETSKSWIFIVFHEPRMNVSQGSSIFAPDIAVKPSPVRRSTMVAGNARQGGDVQHAGGSSAGLGSPEAAASGPAAAAAAAKRRRDRLSAEKKNKRTRAIALNATLQERRDEPEEDTEPDPEDREVPENVSDDEEDDTFPRVALPPLKNSLGKWNELFIVRSAPEMARSVTPHEGAAGEAVVTPTPIRRYNTRQNTQGGRSAAVELKLAPVRARRRSGASAAGRRGPIE